jgi:hypothetical protein
MKLTYSNWHKELVHDDNIQTELSAITKGELEFNNRPFIKHRVENIREEFGGGRRKNFGPRNNRNQGRDNRNNSNRKYGKKRY